MPQIIPVIDLMNGQVVHARRGDRQAYQPLQSSLVDGCDPHDVAQALIEATGARQVYVADIDAIRGPVAGKANGKVSGKVSGKDGGETAARADHATLIAELAVRHPDVEWWVDGGYVDATPALALHRAAGVTPVFGTESMRSYGALRKFRNARIDTVLSLDYRRGVPLGPDWSYDPVEWPARVLAMELGRVGAEDGPALQLIRTLQSMRSDVAVIAAGGVRNREDLRALDGIGVTAVLVASALHDGRLL
ncbi:MAG: HisA/HisF-related TIM barrel protein [Methyloversatilis sp.]|uniref:HisA/HisF-related TIM barrel protein n=1 Tax=Methyloversatilis sp. TaxID=2569862 RepID=UPI0027347D05|nr:HisA/HisF-related TIM barrel protein [Methyloversatilis sp.]MDP3873258.1 HisA/HisF-related TIM barrel protein [Methyloversatilis sp.]